MTAFIIYANILTGSLVSVVSLLVDINSYTCWSISYSRYNSKICHLTLLFAGCSWHEPPWRVVFNQDNPPVETLQSRSFQKSTSHKCIKTIMNHHRKTIRFRSSVIGITLAQIETKQANVISHQCRGLWKQLGTAAHPTSSSRWSVLRAKFRRRTSSCWMPRIACETKTSYLSRNDYNIFGEKIDSDGHDTSLDLKYGFLIYHSIHCSWMGEWAGYIKNSTNKKVSSSQTCVKPPVFQMQKPECTPCGHLFRKFQYIPVLRRPNDFVAYSALLPPPKWRC